MLQGREYVPLLHTRLAEIRAMRELPDSSKDKLVSIFKLRPWLNAKSLSRAVEVVEEAVGSRLYGLDLDEFKFTAAPDPEKPAQAEFAALFDPDNAFWNYYNLVSQGENRIPVYRGVTSDYAIDPQLDRAEEIDRGLFVRVKVTEPGSLLAIAERINDRGTSNPVFVIDCGWGRDILSSAALATGLAQSLFDISEEFEVVIAGSSFPDSFSGLGDRFETTAIERALFAEVRRQLNFEHLVYGDWGSTRPPTDPIPMRNIPRIDTARPSDWISWRSEDDESYVDVAGRTVRDPAWDGRLGIWGEYMVIATAEDEDVCIKSPAMAAAVRVNFHLHQQANFDNPDGLRIGDEIVGDDL